MVALGLWLVLVSHMFSSDSRTPHMQTTYKMLVQLISCTVKYGKMGYVFLCFSEFVFWEAEDYNTKGAVRAESWWWGGARYSVMFPVFWSIRPSKNSSAIYSISQEVTFFYFENFWSSPRMAEPFVGPLAAQAEWSFLLSPCLFAQKG